PGVIVGRLARNADPDGGVGNGRVNIARALSDTSTDPVVPAGAPGGGPVVGPYTIAATNAQPQAQSKPACVGGGGCVGSGPWQTSKVTGWAELDTIPARVFLTKTNAPSPQTQVIVVQFDHTKTQGGVPIPGIENLTNFVTSG